MNTNNHLRTQKSKLVTTIILLSLVVTVAGIAISIPAASADTVSNTITLNYGGSFSSTIYVDLDGTWNGSPFEWDNMQVGTGSSYSLSLDRDTTYTLTCHSAPANNRYVFSNGLSTYTGTSSSTPITLAVYQQVSNTYTVSGLTSGYSVAITGTNHGSVGTTLATLSGSNGYSASAYSDYGTTVTFPATATGSTGNQRYAISSAYSISSLTMSGNTYSQAYTHQVAMKFYYYVAGGGTPGMANYVRITVFGSDTTITPTLTTNPSSPTGASAVWVDEGDEITCLPIYNGDYERWRCGPYFAGPGMYAESWIGTALATSPDIVAYYYHQYEVPSFSYTTNDGSTIPSGTQIGACYWFGHLYNINSELPYGTANVDELAWDNWIDAGTDTVSFSTYVASETEQWVVPTSPHNVAVSGTGSITQLFYHQYKLTLFYQVSGGGSPTVTNVVHYTSNGVPYTATPTLDSSGGTEIWADARTAVTYTSPIAGAAGEQWTIGIHDLDSGAPGVHTMVASVSAAQTITATYYHQYSVSLDFTVIGGGGYSGGPVVRGTLCGVHDYITNVLPFTGWLDTMSTWLIGNSATSISSVLGGSTSTEQWKTSQPTSGAVIAASTTTYTYYHQYAITPYFTLNGGGTLPGSGAVRFTYLGVSVASSPSLGSSGGSPIWADYGSSISYASPISGTTGERYQIASSDSGNHQVIASVTTSQTIIATYYHQYYVTFGYSVSGGTTDIDGHAMPNPTAHYTTFGGSVTIPALRTGAPAYWVDAGSLIQYSNPLDSPFVKERWMTSGSIVGDKSVIDASVAASGTLNPTYYQQWMPQFGITFTGGVVGCSSVPLTGTFLGISSTLTTLTNDGVMHGIWADTGTTIFAPASSTPINGERWSRPTSMTIDVYHSAWVPITYAYHQFAYDLSYSIADSSTPTAPTITGTEAGSPYTAMLTTTATTYWLDANSAWSITNPLSGATSSERYFSSATLSGTVTAAATLSPTYYHQYLQTLSYQLIGGGTPASGPSVYGGKQFGAAYTPTLTTTATGYWFDAQNDDLEISTPVAGAPGEQWYINDDVDCTQANTKIIPLYHQYEVTFAYTTHDGSTINAPIIGHFTCAGTQLLLFSGASYGEVSTQYSIHWVDAGVGKCSFITATLGSERWATDNYTPNINAPFITLQATYSHQFQYYINYAVFDYSSPTAPTLTATQYGSDYKPTLDTNPSSYYWLDIGTPWSVNSPLDGSNAYNYWTCSQTLSGTVSATSPTNIGESITFTYDHYSFPLPGILDNIVVTASSTTVTAGDTVTFDAQGYDYYGTRLGSVTVTYTVNGVPITGNSVAQTATGDYIVSVTRSDATVIPTSFHVNPGPLASITIRASPTNVTPGTPISLSAFCYDRYNNSIAAQSVTFTVNGAPIEGSTVAETKAGDYIVSATNNATIASASFHVNHAAADHLLLTASESSIAAGGNAQYTVSAVDQYGNMWDVTEQTVLGINCPPASHSWVNNVVTVTKAGSWTVTASYAGLTGTVQLTVTHASANTITITPTATTTPAGTPVTFTSTAQDLYGNSWDATSQTNWSTNTSTGGSWTNNIYTAQKAGNYTITGIYAAKSAVATLTVTPAPLDHFTVTAPSSAVQQTAFSITVTALDAYGNTLTDFTATAALSSSTGSINPSLSGNFSSGLWTGTVTLSSQGSQTITAQSNSKTGTSQAITVTAQITPTTNPTVTPTPSPSPSPTPTPTTTPSSTTVTATDTTTQKTYTITLNGNVTASQIMNITITPHAENRTTTVSFTVTGEAGSTGFFNITLPKLAIPYGTVPVIYIDGALASNYGYSQDEINYYIWFTTQFSTHQVVAEFTTQKEEQTTATWLYLAPFALLAAILVLIAFVVMRKRRK